MTDSETGVVTTYYYDLLNRQSGYREQGSNSDHIVEYTYDGENNLSSMTEVINGVTKTYTYTYNEYNRLISETVDGITVEYTYDDFGRLETRVVKQGDAVIQSSTPTYSPGIDPNTTTGQIASYNGYTYTYDANGNILTISDGTNTASYEYDSANQLVRENNQAKGYTKVWTYDNAGNIQSRVEYAYTTAVELENITPTDTILYGYTDNDWGDLLTSYDGKTVSYDTIGNPLSDGEWTYTWQHGRQLASMSKGSTTWNFTYDSSGMRTGRTCNNGYSYQYVYNGSQLTQVISSSGTLYITYDASGTPLTLKYGNEIYYYVTNLQGDVIGLKNSSGVQVTTYTYDAWGNMSASSSSAIIMYNPLTYRGYVYDRETGLYYLQSRYYDPQIGRFLNADALVATGQGFAGNNMFAYCNNNPINWTDPFGYWSLWSSLKDGWNKFTDFLSETFGCGETQANTYDSFSFDTIIYGNETGTSTTQVISGDISKPISVYLEIGTKWWKFTEYKVGIQVNIKDGGFSYSTNTLERSIMISDKNNSVEFIDGLNKIGWTIRSGVDFKNRTAQTYYHEYIRSVPTAVLALACYYTSGALVPYALSLFKGA